MSTQTTSEPVLVVDDEAPVRRAVGDMLRRHGYEVWVEGDVDGALRVARHQKFGWAVVDLNLRGESGMTILRALRTNQPDCIRVLMTGFGSGDVYIEALRDGGVSGIVEKPISSDELLATLDGAKRDQLRKRERHTQRWLETQRQLDIAVAGQLSVELPADCGRRRPWAALGLPRCGV